MTKTMNRVALLGELCSGEIFLEARERRAVAEGPVFQAIKEELLFGVTSLEPALECEERIIRNVDHSPLTILFSLVEMHLPVTKVEVVERETERFTDPDAGPEKQQGERTVTGVVDHGEEPAHILGGYRAGKRVGKREPDRPFQGTPGDEILLDKEVEKGNDEGHPCFYGRDVHTAILLVFDKSFQVSTPEILKIVLA